MMILFVRLCGKMDKLILGFTDTFDSVPHFFLSILEQRYEVIRDDEHPDYLIFGDENFGNTYEKYNNCIKIFYTGENRRYTNYKCHYGITFDHIDSPTHYRLPLYALVMNHHKSLGIPTPFEEYNNRLCGETIEKTEFCGFVASNPNCLERNAMFYKLSDYKQISSGGVLFNNIGNVLPRDDQGIIHKLNFLKNKKFSLVYENGSYPGYVTEKILEAYLGGTVPLYWGSSTIEMDFNPDCMISWHNFLDDDKFIEYIKHVDNAPAVYHLYNHQPLFKNNTPNRFMNVDRFLDWFEKNVYRGSSR